MNRFSTLIASTGEESQTLNFNGKVAGYRKDPFTFNEDDLDKVIASHEEVINKLFQNPEPNQRPLPPSLSSITCDEMEAAYLQFQAVKSDHNSIRSLRALLASDESPEAKIASLTTEERLANLQIVNRRLAAETSNLAKEENPNTRMFLEANVEELQKFGRLLEA